MAMRCHPVERAVRANGSRSRTSFRVPFDPTIAELADLYYALLAAWNRQHADAYAALFNDDGYVAGFDGSEMNGREEIQCGLAAIFADHETGRYVAKIRAE